MGLCLRRLRLQYPLRGWQGSTGISGSFQSESVATFAWNRWQGSTGISGNLRAEYANEAVECRHPRLVQRIESAPECVIIEMAGLNTGGNEAREGFMLEKMGYEGELLVDKTETVEHHSFDGMASSHNAHGRVLLRRL